RPRSRGGYHWQRNVLTGMSIGLDGGPTKSATIKYSNSGVPLWTNRYDGLILSMAVDSSDNVFETGAWNNGGNWDYATIKYSKAGLPLWTNRYDGPGNGDDFARAIAVDSSGNVFVTGDSY